MPKQSSSSYDVIIIGAGPGGYVCAIRCAQLGLKVACVEKGKSLGGTCLNVGCIPSKALLQASQKYEEAQHSLGAFGVTVEKVSLDLKGMMKHKENVVSANTKGIEFLFKKNKIDWIQGTATIEKAGQVSVDGQSYQANSIVIATGSDVVSLPNIKIDENQIVSSTGALSLSKVPKTMVVIGGGVIGLEMGAVWSRLGSEVTIVEYMDKILSETDEEISKDMLKILKKQGINFKLSTKVMSAKTLKTGVDLSLESATGGKAEKLKAEIVLVAVGRAPYTNGLGLDKIGVNFDVRGRIVTDETFESSVEGIFAIGDVIAGPMLAHKAEEEGVILAEMLAGQTGHIDYNLIPSVVYTHPEVAQIGKTEQALKEEKVSYKVGKFPYMANGRARAMNELDGFVKILADATTDKVLGAHILGAEAGNLIHEIAAVMEFGGSAEDISRICHAHPTLAELVKEAALAVDNRPIHT